MEVITGDETGLLKLVNLSTKSYLTYGDIQNRERGINAIVNMQSCTSSTAAPLPFVIQRVNGELELWKKMDKELVCVGKPIACGINQPIKCVRLFHENRIVSFNSSGEVISHAVDLNDIAWKRKIKAREIEEQCSFKPNLAENRSFITSSNSSSTVAVMNNEARDIAERQLEWKKKR